MFWLAAKKVLLFILSNKISTFVLVDLSIFPDVGEGIVHPMSWSSISICLEMLSSLLFAGL